jgi:hypothetical protein
MEAADEKAQAAQAALDEKKKDDAGEEPEAKDL